MLAYYGYKDASGEYYVCINADRCNGCGKCVTVCPKNILEMTEVFIELEDKTVACIKESVRKEIKYLCSACDHQTQKTPCILACQEEAISTIWE